MDLVVRWLLGCCGLLSAQCSFVGVRRLRGLWSIICGGYIIISGERHEGKENSGAVEFYWCCCYCGDTYSQAPPASQQQLLITFYLYTDICVKVYNSSSGSSRRDRDYCPAQEENLKGQPTTTTTTTINARHSN